MPLGGLDVENVKQLDDVPPARPVALPTLHKLSQTELLVARVFISRILDAAENFERDVFR
jgi:hypothetical protein